MLEKELSCSNRSGLSNPRLELQVLITDHRAEKKRCVRSVHLAGMKSRMRSIQLHTEPLA